MTVLLALVVALALVVGHAVLGHAQPAAAPVAVIAPAASATPSPKPTPSCPSPKKDAVRAAPTGRQPKSVKTVALTFDDGPGPWTGGVLKVLQTEHVHATFFMIGRRAAAEPAAVRRVAAAGHLVANHSWSHPYRTDAQGWTSAGLTTEIQRTQRTLTHATGKPPCFFRPPGGVLKGARGPTRAADLSIALWSVDPRDWSGQTPHRKGYAATIRNRARAGLTQPHPVVLLHDGGGYRAQTVAALPGIIADYRAAGYTFVTLDGRT